MAMSACALQRKRMADRTVYGRVAARWSEKSMFAVALKNDGRRHAAGTRGSTNSAKAAHMYPWSARKVRTLASRVYSTQR